MVEGFSLQLRKALGATRLVDVYQLPWEWSSSKFSAQDMRTSLGTLKKRPRVVFQLRKLITSIVRVNRPPQGCSRFTLLFEAFLQPVFSFFRRANRGSDRVGVAPSKDNRWKLGTTFYFSIPRKECWAVSSRCEEVLKFVFVCPSPFLSST